MFNIQFIEDRCNLMLSTSKFLQRVEIALLILEGSFGYLLLKNSVANFNKRVFRSLFFKINFTLACKIFILVPNDWNT